MRKIIALFFLFSGYAVQAQNVFLNPDFGNAGLTIIPNTSEINCFDFDEEGNIFSAGYTLEANGIYHLTISKTKKDGTPDHLFGTLGKTLTTIAHSEFPLAVTMQPDGKILVAGSYSHPPTPFGPGPTEGFVVRYNTNGKLDSSFASFGIFYLYEENSHFSSISILDNGSILLGGNGGYEAIICKLNADGIQDLQFGNNGIVRLSEPGFRFVFWEWTKLRDGNFLCVGYDYSEPGNTNTAFCKIDANGEFVISFGDNGTVLLDLFNSMSNISELVTSAKELPDGKIILTGFHMLSTILKIDAHGKLDSSFGVNGIAEHRFPNKDLELQADGKILLAGSKVISDYNYGISITRFRQDGGLDESFNGTGFFDLDVSPGSDYLQEIRLVDSATIIVAGSTRANVPDANFLLASVNLSMSLSTNFSSKSSNEFLLYPNPFSESFFIKDDKSRIRKIDVYDVSGRLIKMYNTNTAKHLVNINAPAGVYHVNIETKDGNVFNKKIIKK